MSAEAPVVYFEVSDRDADSGLDVTRAWYNGKEFSVKNSHGNTQANAWVAFGISAEQDIIDKVIDWENFEYTSYNGITYTLLGENRVRYASGNFADIQNGGKTLLTELGGGDVRVVISLLVDSKSADNKVNGGDGVDDRTQKTYAVHLEDAVASGYYSPVEYYTVNNGDNLVKLVTDGDYKNLPGWGERTRKNGATYYYEYTIDGDDIYAEWVEADHSSFASKTTPENTLDKDGDGVVTCDEYYGVTGLKWDDKKNACVTTSGNAVVVVPDTSAR